MKSFLSLVVFFVLLSFSTSCVSKKAYADSISNPDYNQRIMVENPSIIKKENALGVSISIGITGLGGYLGYQYGPIKLPDANKSEVAQVGNSMLGALAGYSLTRVVTYLLGKNKIKNPTNKNDWVKKIKRNYTLIRPLEDKNSWELIKKSSETNFKIHNIQDVRDFVSSFPNSTYENDMSLKAMAVLPRHNIPELVNLISNSKNLGKAKEKYLDLSKTVAQFKQALQKYPEARSNCDECKIINTILPVSSKADLFFLATEFSKSSCITKVHSQLISKVTTINECVEVIKQFSSLQTEAGNKAYALAETINDYNTVAINFPSVSTKASNQAESLRKKAFEEAEKLRKENEYKAFLDEQIVSIARQSGYDIMNKTSDLGTGHSLDVAVKNYKINENNMVINMKVSWEATLYSTSNYFTGENVTCWVRGILKVNLDDNSTKFYDKQHNATFAESADWAESRMLYLGAIVLTSYAIWESTQWSPEEYKGASYNNTTRPRTQLDQEYSDNNSNLPCFEVISEGYLDLFSSERKYFKIKCGNGKEKKITYNSKLSKPFSPSSNFLLSYKTLDKAARVDCKCR